MMNCECRLTAAEQVTAENTHSFYSTGTNYQRQGVSGVNIIPDILQIIPQPSLLRFHIAAKLFLQRIGDEAWRDGRFQAGDTSINEIEVFVGSGPIRRQDIGHNGEHLGYQLADLRLVQSYGLVPP